MECQYEEAENAFLILAQNIQQKTKKERSDVDIDLGSGVWALKSSLKVLFQYQPEYMAAVCDAVTQKMDLLLRGDDPNFCDCNRWDILLKQWFQAKTFAEQEKMRQVRAKRIRQRIITKKESIHPEYLLSNAEIILRLPNIRLPEITRPPVAYLYQRNRLVAECKMSVYGDSMCYTTQEFSFDLEHIDGIHFDEGFDFRVEIRCGGNIVYDSLTELCRDYIVFNEKGFETSIAKCLEGRAWIIAAGDAKVEVDDPDDDYYDESVNYQCFYVSLLSTKALLVNGTYDGQGGEYHLSHVFKTDVVQITFLTNEATEFETILSAMYALLEGLSRELGIERTDLKGCLHRQNWNGLLVYSIILYDAVAGGAGHVRRLVTDDGKIFSQVLRSAYNIVESCDCDPSCYHCLRNYYNQQWHDILDRKKAKDFLANWLGECVAVELPCAPDLPEDNAEYVDGSIKTSGDSYANVEYTSWQDVFSASGFDFSDPTEWDQKDIDRSCLIMPELLCGSENIEPYLVWEQSKVALFDEIADAHIELLQNSGWHVVDTTITADELKRYLSERN